VDKQIKHCQSFVALFLTKRHKSKSKDRLTSTNHKNRELRLVSGEMKLKKLQSELENAKQELASLEQERSQFIRDQSDLKLTTLIDQNNIRILQVREQQQLSLVGTVDAANRVNQLQQEYKSLIEDRKRMPKTALQIQLDSLQSQINMLKLRMSA
jgi:multidrug efflux pump subunit AcrA (membrane-fusion protein)